VTKPQLASLYILAVVLAGAAAVAYATVTARPASPDLVMLALLIGLAAASERAPIFLFRSSAISVAFAATIAAYVLYGTGAGLWVNLGSAAVSAVTPRPKPLRKAAFNAGQLSVAAFLASTVYHAVGGQVPPGAIAPTVLAVCVSAAVYFVVNSTLTAAVIALTSDARFRTVWLQNFAWMPVNYAATAVNGAALAIAYQGLGVFGAAVFVLPVGVAWYSFKLYMVKSTEVRQRADELSRRNMNFELTNDRLEEAHLSLIGALCGSVEAMDPHTSKHSAATMFHSVELAKRLGLNDKELAAVKLGAMFHDIGKIGIPEDILRKPDRLRDDEWVLMKAHPRIGADLLAHVPDLKDIAPIVLAHHERYDGTGYPAGLKKGEIPLAAQIIAVVDAYQAMTETRPYRLARTPELAIEELRRVSGTQLNPVVVEAFVAEILDERERVARGEKLDHVHTYSRDQVAVALGIAS
jgi:putative nucleotidyltransferase with HDIG domain